MWELVESIVYFFKYKKWPLPLFIVLLFIILTFIWSAYDPSEKIKESLTVPVVEVSPTPDPPILLENKKQLPKYSRTEPDNKPEARQQDHEHYQEKPVEQEGNVTHFQHSLTDTLKIEGLESTVAAKIFKHMREQLGRSENLQPYDLEESIRAALGPDADDSEVYRIKDLVSKAATESSNLMQDR